MERDKGTKLDPIKRFIQVKIGGKNIQIGFNLNIPADRNLYDAITQKKEIISKNTRIKLLLDDFYNNSESETEEELLAHMEEKKEDFSSLNNQIKRIIASYYINGEKISLKKMNTPIIRNEIDDDVDDFIDQMRDL